MKPITIIGGGLAGLTLGIGLRQRGVPTTILEAGRYPRHRVCGEFISGAGAQVLRSLGLDDLMRDHARPATDCAFFTPHRLLFRRPLPSQAISVSRFHLDAALAKRFRSLGGELREGERGREGNAGDGMVIAMGRRARPVEHGWRWFGLKIHARGVSLQADLEMHLARDSYVGVCQLADGEVNVCGLFRRRANEPGRGESMNWLRGLPGSKLFQRLEQAEFDADSFCAVAGLSLRPQTIDPIACRIGDALTMIPPITGNGMSMAFESAQLALEPLATYALGSKQWAGATEEIAGALQQSFASRLRWAGLFHRVLFSRFSAPVLGLLADSQRGWRAAFAATR